MRDPQIDSAAATMLTVGFSGTTLTDSVKGLLDRGVSGVVLFSRNLGTRDDVAQLVSELKTYAGRPLFIAIDQEGGVVQRLRDGFARIPPMRVLGSIGDEMLAERLGEVLAYQLRSVGIDVDFAPVLDVDTNPDNPVIGNRALSRDPEVVARLGVALGRGLEKGGVAACGKHFPGHGDTTQDSHFELPRLNHALDRLRAIELLPFRAWREAELSSVMTAHVVFSALDSTYPATMSQAVLAGILRGELGYQGLVFSDDLEMRAILDHFGPREAAERGLEAGVDNFLCCHTSSVAHEVIDALGAAALASEAMSARVFEAGRRVDDFVRRWAAAPGVARPAVPGAIQSDEQCAEVVAEILARATEGADSSRVDPTEVRVTTSIHEQQDQQ